MYDIIWGWKNTIFVRLQNLLFWKAKRYQICTLVWINANELVLFQSTSQNILFESFKVDKTTSSLKTAETVVLQSRHMVFKGYLENDPEA